MTRENIEKNILPNLSYVPEKQELDLNVESLFDMLIVTDINSTRQKFFEINCKLIMPEYMLSPNYQKEYEKFSRDLPNERVKMVTIDISIK